MQQSNLDITVISLYSLVAPPTSKAFAYTGTGCLNKVLVLTQMVCINVYPVQGPHTEMHRYSMHPHASSPIDVYWDAAAAQI